MVNKRKLVYRFISIWTNGGGPWSSLGQESSEPIIDGLIPKLWKLGEFVDDSRGNGDVLYDIFGEEGYRALTDEEHITYDQRVTDGWIASNVAKAIIDVMGGPIVMASSVAEQQKAIAKIEKSIIDSWTEYVKTGVEVA